MPTATSEPGSTAEPQTWERSIESFLNGGGRFAKSTIGTYRPALRRFAEVARSHGYELPSDIDTTLLEHYGTALKAWGPAPRTRGLHVVCVRRFVGWLRAHGARGVPEVWQVKTILPSEPVGDPNVVATSRPDLKRLLVAKDAPPRDRAIWALAAFAGLRATEIARLKLSAFGHDESGWTIGVKRGKRGIERSIPLVDEVAGAVSAYLIETGRRLGRSKGFVFEAEDPYAEARGTQGLSRQTIYKVIRKTAEDLGIESCNPRELRNAFAVLFLRAGGDLSELQDLLGHESAARTAVFLSARNRSVARETIERQLALVEDTDDTLMGRSAGDGD